MTKSLKRISEAIRLLEDMVEDPKWSQILKLASFLEYFPGAKVLKIKHQGGQDWGLRNGRDGLCVRIGRSAGRTTEKNYEIWAIAPGCSYRKEENQ
jgi:hypothetical protein